VATLYWRGDRAYLNWSEGGQQHRRSLGRLSPHDAEIRRQAKELELSTGRKIFVASATFVEHVGRYLTWHDSQYPHSHYRVKQIATQHFADFTGSALSQITGPLIERWKAQRMTLVSRESAAKELRTLKAILEKAVEWGEIEKNPAKYVTSPKSLDSEPMHWYSRAQLQKLHKCRHGATWRLMVNTGLRRSEAMQLMWEHVDLKRGNVNVVSTEDARTKSGHWRQIPLSEGARAALARLKRKKGRTDYVLPRITSESLSRAFLTDAERLGLPGSLHTLRHTYAAHLVMAGVPLRTVQVLMGHASFKTTERYAHLGKDHLRRQALRVSL
jgi:integrase